MNLELFITKRIALGDKKSFSRFIIKISVLAVALSISVMIIATSMVNGFQKEISEKVFGFWGHLHIAHFNIERSAEETPVILDTVFIDRLDSLVAVRHVQQFAHKAGIIKTSDDIEGIVLKGIGPDFDWTFFDKYLKAGRAFQITDTARSNQILISNYTAQRLKLDTSDEVIVYFIQEPPRVRKFKISGIYKSGLLEFDKFYALVDIGHIQRLNNWEPDAIGGYEVFLHDVNRLDKTSDQVYYNLLGPDLYAYTLKEIYPNIFDWLQLQNTNEVAILVLMVLVAAINMITTLLILILERTNMIGILKALGATNRLIRSIFIYNALYIISLGLLIGNVLGIGICLLQKHFGLITLPEDSYYISVAPVDLNGWIILAINLGSLLICTLVLLIPSMLISRISPVKAIRFQ